MMSGLLIILKCSLRDSLQEFTKWITCVAYNCGNVLDTPELKITRVSGLDKCFVLSLYSLKQVYTHKLHETCILHATRKCNAC